MNEEFVLGLGHDALRTTLFVAGPMLLVAMVVGITVSLLQAVTQINEATLTFIPKIAAIVLVLVLASPWMLDVLTSYTTELITHMPEYIR